LRTIRPPCKRVGAVVARKTAMADDACQLFGVLDTNKDGALSPDEFSLAYRSGIIAHGPKSPCAASAEPAADPAQPGIRRAPTESALKLAEASLAAALAVQQGQISQSEATAMVTDAAVAVAVRKATKLQEDAANPKFQKAFAEAEQRLAAAREAHAKLKVDAQLLQKENAELKQAVAKARVNAERRILRKRAENVQLLADNAELEHFTSEARELSEQKARFLQTKSVDGSSEWEVLQASNNAIRRRLEKVIARPQRMPLDGTLDSPGSYTSSLEATPRIDAVLHWRRSQMTDPLPSLGVGMDLRPLQETRVQSSP